MTRKFQVGDKVRANFGHDYYDGSEGIVTRVEGGKVWYRYTKRAYSGRGFDIGHVSDLYHYKLVLVEPAKAEEDVVNDPSHYGGADNPYEVIKVAEAWGFDKDSYLFNVLKYIARAHRKGAEGQDLGKARYYLDRKITRLEEAK